MDDRIIQILSDSFWNLVIPGIKVTVPLTLVSFALGLTVAVLCALALVAKVPVLSSIIRFYVWIIRGTPLLVQLFIIFYGLPNLGIVIDPIPSAILAFTLSVGAYCTETIRGAIRSVPVGQIEAGACAGLNYLQIMFLIVLPQAFRSAFPALFNSFISLVKDTSLAASVTVTEMFMTAQRIAARTYEPFWLYIEVALIYLVFCTVLTAVQNRGEKWLNRYA